MEICSFLLQTSGDRQAVMFSTKDFMDGVQSLYIGLRRNITIHIDVLVSLFFGTSTIVGYLMPNEF